jgi:hypothetical protein
MAITNFIPTLWSALINEKLQKSLVYGAAANRNYEGDLVYGSSVNITSFANLTVNDYKKYGDVAYQQLEDSSIQLLIDQMKTTGFLVDDVDKAQARADVMGDATTNIAYVLGDVADQYLAGLMAAGVSEQNKLTAVDATSDPGKLYETLVQLGVKLDEANVPSQYRFAIVSPDQYGLLLQDPRFVTASDTAHQVLENGVVGTAAGFSIQKSNNAPKGADGKSRTLIAGSSIATTFAEQINKVEARHQDFKDYVAALHVYGAKVIKPEALATVDITTAAPVPGE